MGSRNSIQAAAAALVICTALASTLSACSNQQQESVESDKTGTISQSKDTVADNADTTTQGLATHRDPELVREEQVADIVTSGLTGNTDGLTERMEGRALEMLDSKRAEIDANVAALQAMSGTAERQPKTAEEAAAAAEGAARAAAIVEALEAEMRAKGELSEPGEPVDAAAVR